ncbi:DUF4375 domain-containing protein [uncultured Pontibacter sp.]|uniref:DMP19 family protein n=1 Tax=uncultured Pontibacter sp. TaxID=453356 RepID=UPI002615C748|nr:DUF4375 domain-containing protein [uncultured Pontibacter sp.]
MDKQKRQDLKKKYKEEQLATDPNLQFLSKLKEQISQTSDISKEKIERRSDEELEQKIVNYVYNRFENAGRAPKAKNQVEWEREVLQSLPVGVRAVYATYLFESDLNLNGSFWDFFYQNNGAFAIDTLNGYRLMEEMEMVEILEQCIGAYLKMLQSGEIEELYGVVHDWSIDEEYFISRNKKSFEELDREYLAMETNLVEELRTKKVKFIRNHPGLLITEK